MVYKQMLSISSIISRSFISKATFIILAIFPLALPRLRVKNLTLSLYSHSLASISMYNWSLYCIYSMTAYRSSLSLAWFFLVCSNSNCIYIFCWCSEIFYWVSICILDSNSLMQFLCRSLSMLSSYIFSSHSLFTRCIFSAKEATFSTPIRLWRVL